MFSRRDLGKLALGALPPFLAGKPNSVFRGTILGAHSYSFRDRQLDRALKAMEEIGFGYCEIWQGHVEPALGRAALREWRETTKVEQFGAIREQFSAAGIRIYAYHFSFTEDFSDREMDRAFEITRALGARYLTTPAAVDMVPRIAAFASKHKTLVALQNTSTRQPNEISSPDEFARMLDLSDSLRISLDIGEFTAANFDPLDYMKRMSERIITLRFKDRKKDFGPNVPFGQGDTPVRQILLALSEGKLKIPAMIAYEYEGANAVAEVQRCFDFCRKTLEG